MEIQEQITELAGRIKAGQSRFIGYDEIHEWPMGLLDELVAKGILVETAPSKTVVCRDCRHECSIEPRIEVLPQTGETVGLHLCETQGMIKVDPTRLRQWEIIPDKLPPDLKVIALPKKLKKKRATKSEIEGRNRNIAMAAAKIQVDRGRLPTVDEVMDVTKLTRQQIYDSAPYKEEKIAKASAKITTEMTGSSVQKTDFFGATSEEHGRRKNRSKAEQAELDALIDQQGDDDSTDFVKI